jgi:hypothetical protein
LESSANCEFAGAVTGGEQAPGAAGDATSRHQRNVEPNQFNQRSSAGEPTAAHQWQLGTGSLTASATGFLTADGPDDHDLAGATARAVADCRRRRAPLSLMLVALCDYDNLLFEVGANKAAALLNHARNSAAQLWGPQAITVPASDGQFAVLLADCDRTHAVETARLLLKLARSGRVSGGASSVQPLALNIGVASVAMPAKNFPAADLVAAAQRCLFAAEAGGSDGVKSIDVL